MPAREQKYVMAEQRLRVGLTVRSLLADLTKNSANTRGSTGNGGAAGDFVAINVIQGRK